MHGVGDGCSVARMTCISYLDPDTGRACRTASRRRARSVLAGAVLFMLGCDADRADPDPAPTPAAQEASAATDAAAPASPVPPTSCNGIPVPPRAYAKKPPFAVGPAAGGLPDYWPTQEWKSRAPEELGFDAAKLARAVEFKTRYSNTQALLVIRHGYVAYEKYFAPFTASTQHESYSMAKSFTSGLVGIAIGEGKLSSTAEKICKYYPRNWNCNDASDPRSRITVQHALNLTTGLEWNEDWRSTARGKPNDPSTPGDMLEKILSRKALQEPGTSMRYSTGDPALLTEVLQQSTGMTALAYAKQKIFDVIGTPRIRWNQDAKGRTTTFAGLSATAREFAKYGYLYLHRGQWDGKQVVPADWVDFTTRAEKPCSDWNRNLWHQNLPVRFGTQDPACPTQFCQPTTLADLPADGFLAKGVFGQYMIVIPSADLVIVRFAQDQYGSEHWDDYGRGLIPAVLDAIK
jgi:CubicO group peptidase (beta-lactamase class C family)